MKITVLVDNNTFIDQYCIGEPALSFFIESEGMNILFDTGYSDAWLRNAASLGIDLSDVSTIVFSHGHNDHTYGMKYSDQTFTSPIQLIGHPDIFLKRYENDKFIGSGFSFEELDKRHTLVLSSKPVEVNDKLTFLGEIPSYFDFEKRKPIGVFKDNGVEYPDYVMDDSALVHKSDEGLFIITGCSHSGICNIIEYAKQVCRENKIIGVLGGFHLLSASDKLNQTIDYFKKNNITNLYPGHCVSFVAKAEIHKQIPIHEVGVGLSINI